MFWMWIIAILGSASALAESTLAQIYKKKGEDGKCYGGPAYYIEAALHSRGLAVVFCIAMILTYAFGFNMLASYNLQSTFAGQPFYNADITPWIIGGILALVMGWCLLGGGNRIVKVTSTLVPFMGIAYILVSLLVVVNILLEGHFCRCVPAGPDGGNPKRSVFQVRRDCVCTKCSSVCSSQPSGQAGTCTNVVCVY